jgi:hypothetical protein
MLYDMLVWFNVEALFPSIPVDDNLDFLKKWLREQNLNLDVLMQYSEFAKFVIKFQFNEKFYEQMEGTAIGKALLPSLANLYMANFKMVPK